ncbi:MAG: hydrogenase iron-sulfur subunit [Thermodesulfobacteriota bacterium]
MSSTPTITIFFCVNLFPDEGAFSDAIGKPCRLKSVPMPCSGMVKDIYLLKAFESGSDAVLVMTCPLGLCRHGEGNLRALKRVGFVKTILNEIGFEEFRLNIIHIPSGDKKQAHRAIENILSELAVSEKIPLDGRSRQVKP